MYLKDSVVPKRKSVSRAAEYMQSSRAKPGVKERELKIELEKLKN